MLGERFLRKGLPSLISLPGPIAAPLQPLPDLVDRAPIRSMVALRSLASGP